MLAEKQEVIIFSCMMKKAVPDALFVGFDYLITARFHVARELCRRPLFERGFDLKFKGVEISCQQSTILWTKGR